MTKEEVKRIFKSSSSKGKDIANAVNQYWKEQIALKKIKPVEYYKPQWNKDSFKEAQKIFSY